MLQQRRFFNEIDSGGQINSLAVSPDNTKIVVTIENEHNEDFKDRSLPQIPTGTFVVITNTDKGITRWTTENIAMTSLKNIRGLSDQEPEYVAINSDSIFVVTLQEDNGITIVVLPNHTIIRSFNTRTVNLDGVDTENDGVVSQTGTLMNTPLQTLWFHMDWKNPLCDH